MKSAHERVALALTVLAVAVIMASNLRSQAFYVGASRGGQIGFNEIRDASGTHFLDELQRKLPQRPQSPIVSDTNNIVLAKIESMYARPEGIMFPTESFLTFQLPAGFTVSPLFVAPSLYAAGARLEQDIKAYQRPAEFTFDEGGACYTDKFTYDARPRVLIARSSDPVLVQSTPEQSIFNRWGRPAAPLHNIDVLRYRNAKNDLVQVVSDLARGYYFGNRINVAVFQLESDWFYPGYTMAGVGRYLLLRVINPTKGARVEISYTASLRADGINRIPAMSVKGAVDSPFPVVGRGSARVFSAPVVPQLIHGNKFIEVDLGEDPVAFHGERHGLNQLYGRDVPIDSRLLTGFVRDISMVSGQQYDEMRAPSLLRAFPGDLQNNNLQYSGMYEDGWVSEDSSYRLRQPTTSTRLVVRGVVPLINDAAFRTQLSVSVDGKVVATRILGPGTFAVEAPMRAVRALPRASDVLLQFSRFQRLPGPNPWPVGARLDAVGFL